MKINALALCIGVAALLVACSKPTDADNAVHATTNVDAYQASLARIDEMVGTRPTTQADSLSYYLGRSEGEAFKSRLVIVPDQLRDSINKREYLLGVYAAITADTTSISYGEGLTAAVDIARYLNVLELQGVKINRAVLVKTLAAMAQNPPTPEQIAEADSISNILILRDFK